MQMQEAGMNLQEHADRGGEFDHEPLMKRLESQRILGKIPQEEYDEMKGKYEKHRRMEMEIDAADAMKDARAGDVVMPQEFEFEQTFQQKQKQKLAQAESQMQEAGMQEYAGQFQGREEQEKQQWESWSTFMKQRQQQDQPQEAQPPAPTALGGGSWRDRITKGESEASSASIGAGGSRHEHELVLAADSEEAAVNEQELRMQLEMEQDALRRSGLATPDDYGYNGYEDNVGGGADSSYTSDLAPPLPLSLAAEVAGTNSGGGGGTGGGTGGGGSSGGKDWKTMMWEQEMESEGVLTDTAQQLTTMRQQILEQQAEWEEQQLQRQQELDRQLDYGYTTAAANEAGYR